MVLDELCVQSRSRCVLQLAHSSQFYLQPEVTPSNLHIATQKREREGKHDPASPISKKVFEIRSILKFPGLNDLTSRTCGSCTLIHGHRRPSVRSTSIKHRGIRTDQLVILEPDLIRCTCLKGLQSMQERSSDNYFPGLR